MPLTFRAQVWKVAVDHDQEITATLKIPVQDFDEALPLGKLTQRVVVVTVFTQEEVRET